MRRIITLLLFLILSSAAFADSYVQIILDASGSMWARLDDGRYRIVAAKEALGGLVSNLPDSGLNVGLRVYGSRLEVRAEGSCEDTRLVVPMQGVDKSALMNAIDDVTALGATPIAASLAAARNDFPDADARRLIVLVTDGQESCGGDLAGEVTKLKEAGIELRIIGYALPGYAADAFAQLATFESAASAEELAAALHGAVEEAVEVTPETTEVKLANVTLEAPSEVQAGTDFTVNWSGEPGDNDALALLLPEVSDTELPKGAHYIDPKRETTTFVAPLEAGEYELRYVSAGQVVVRQPVVVLESPATLQVLSEAVLAGARFEVAWTGPDGPQDYLTIVPPGTPDADYGYYEYTRKGAPLTLLAPSDPGDYLVRYQSDTEPGVVIASVPLEVLPPAPVILESPGTVVQGNEVLISWSGPDAERDYITIVPAGAAEGAYLDYEYTTKGNPLTLRAPHVPGEYEIRYSTDRSDASGRIFGAAPLSVTAAEIQLSVEGEVRVGESFTVNVDGPFGHRDYITIVPTTAGDGEYGSYAYVSQAGPATLTAPEEPGEYEVRYQSDLESGYVMGRTTVQVR